jgi:hypothetical protein
LQGSARWKQMKENSIPPLPALFIVTALLFSIKAHAGTYATNFPLNEDPISESGRWVGGKTVGLLFSDFQSISGLAFGKESGTNPAKYDDAIALLTGTWGPNQTVQATVMTVNQKTNPIFEELEIRLRSTITANSSTGYECNFSARNSAHAYVEIVRWNGPMGDFTRLVHNDGASMALKSGDTIRCTALGTTITAYINGVQKAKATDSTFASGNPGMGAYLQGATGLNRDYGFVSFAASDAAGWIAQVSPTAPHRSVGANDSKGK